MSDEMYPPDKQNLLSGVLLPAFDFYFLSLTLKSHTIEITIKSLVCIVICSTSSVVVGALYNRAQWRPTITFTSVLTLFALHENTYVICACPSVYHPGLILQHDTVFICFISYQMVCFNLLNTYTTIV